MNLCVLYLRGVQPDGDSAAAAAAAPTRRKRQLDPARRLANGRSGHEL